ncbi:hypothetical protein [Micromonospora sp. WMMD975]|uniref:hypothetical protein n=1 Tax=Micromonospora sp. WMMD975 TaxID=3016087 RepID=UPI00249BB2C3|nr:hypothetical protein [Micromonospora sp. WMMD975]WFE32422.1 hypothetical protein O7613_23010 [Micromonospora sp. WMMD975]
MTDPHWIIHLPTTLTSIDEAAALAMALRRSLGHVLAVDFGETTLSEEDRQSARTPVWCDARLPGPLPRRCQLPASHPGGCRAESWYGTVP